MNIDEGKEILNVLYVTYPQSFKDWKPKQWDLISKLWAKHFQNVPTALVMKAVDDFIDTDSKFAPTIGEIMTRVKDEITVFNAETQWAWVQNIVRNDSENLHLSIKKKLDPIAQELIDTSDIKRYKAKEGTMDYDKKEFVDEYNKRKEKREREAVKTGNLYLISRPDKLMQLGLKDYVQIEHKEG